MAEQQSSDAAAAAVANSTASLSEKLNKMIASNSLDYNSWRALILEIESTFPDDINTISLGFDSFMSKFPLCHWHLEKYAYHKAKLSSAREAIEIFERGAGTAMFSVGFWVDYFTFCTTCFEDPEDVRRLFWRALSCVGKDYFCHVLWDKYMKYEFNQEGWHFLAQSYVQALSFPTKKLHFYYDNFKQFVANLEEEMGYEKSQSDEVELVSVTYAAKKKSRNDISLLVKDLLDSSDRPIKSKALGKYRSIGEDLYQEACQLDEKIKFFETNIQRRYFHTDPLDDDQLNNWHLYLDFIEKQDNLDWAIKLYERCLIPCANYSEFWMRYVDFLDTKRGRKLSLSALDRATKTFLKSDPEIHRFHARFKERIGDVDGARAALLLCNTKSDSSFVENVVAQANMERRLGNLSAASEAYDQALKTAKEKQQLHIIPSLYSHFARLTYMITGSADAARDVLIDGIRQVPGCKFLYEELINFTMTHEGANHVDIVDSVVADAISPGLAGCDRLNTKERETVSCLFLEFVNLCGTVHDFRKAWNQHIKLFPQFLRLIPTYKHYTSSKSWLDAARDQKQSCNFAAIDESRKDHSSGHPSQLEVLDVPVNHAILPSQVLGKQLLEKGHNNDTERVKAVSTVVFNEAASQDNEPAYNLSCGTREDTCGVMNVSVGLSNNFKDNAIILHGSVHGLSSQSRDDKLGPVDVISELANQSKESASSPHESGHEFGKTSITTEPAKASPSSKDSLGQEIDHDLKHEKQLSFDEISSNSQEKDSQVLNPMSCEENNTKKNVPATGESTNTKSGSFSGSRGSQTFELPLLHNELERDGPVNHLDITPKQIHTDRQEGPEAGEDFSHRDRMGTAPKRKSSGFHGHLQDQEHQLHKSSLDSRQSAHDLDNKMLMNRGNAHNNSAKKIRRREQLGITANHAQCSNTTPSSSTSARQSPISSSHVSYPQQNALPTNQHPGQPQQSHSTSQMLQYHYNQQHFLQQQQSYLQMQQQYTNPQPYQLQSQQNQQLVQLVNQQNYVQQQYQSYPYMLQQQIPNFQQAPQQFQEQHQQQNQQVVGNLQAMQGSQDLSYLMHQLGYQQHAAQGQQLHFQQYQQYQQGYHHLQHQQPSQEGHLPMEEQQTHQHPSQQQQDEQMQKQNLSQNQQDPKTASLAKGLTAKPAVSSVSQGK